MALFNTKKQVLLSNYIGGSLILINLDGEIIDEISPLKENTSMSLFVQPWAICVNKLDQICVHDCSLHRQQLSILNSNFEIIKEIKDIEWIDMMTFDMNKINKIYTVCDLIEKLNIKNDKQTCLNFKNGTIVSPYNIYVSENKIYITSATHYKYHDNKLRNLNMIISGANCIYVANKFNNEIIQVIHFDNWLDPRGLHVDENLHIWTLAFKLDENKIRSKYRYLFIINMEGLLLKDIYLETIDWFNDVVLHENKLITCHNNYLNFIEIE